MEIPMTTAELENLINQRGRLISQIEVLREERSKVNFKPYPLEDGVCLEEMRTYKSLLDEFEIKETEYNSKQNFLSNQLEGVNLALISAIPIKNVWVKVGEKAVGIYLDFLGGDHMCLDIIHWPPVRKCVDHTSYP